MTSNNTLDAAFACVGATVILVAIGNEIRRTAQESRRRHRIATAALDCLRRNPGGVPAHRIADAAGCSDDDTIRVLIRLIDDGRVQRTVMTPLDPVTYALAEENADA